MPELLYIAGHSILNMIQILGRPYTITFIIQIFIIIAYISKAYIIIKKLFTYNFWVRFNFLNNKINRKNNLFHVKKEGNTVHRKILWLAIYSTSSSIFSEFFLK
jgi:hypothetical protein